MTPIKDRKARKDEEEEEEEKEEHEEDDHETSTMALVPVVGKPCPKKIIRCVKRFDKVQLDALEACTYLHT